MLMQLLMMPGLPRLALPRKDSSLMPQRLLPVVTFSLIALFLLFGPVNRVRADASPTHTHVTVDGYSAELILPGGPAASGPNPVIVRLLNADNRPVSDATVLLAPSAVAGADAGHSHSSGGGHDAAGAQGHTDAATSGHDASSDGHAHEAGEAHVDTIMTQLEAGSDAGNYTGVIHFDSAGAWQVQLQFDHAGGVHTSSFSLTVAEPARDWRILGAFGAANALIIVIAGVLKWRSPPTAKRTRAAEAAYAEN
jgi:hypothetical protein